MIRERHLTVVAIVVVLVAAGYLLGPQVTGQEGSAMKGSAAKGDHDPVHEEIMQLLHAREKAFDTQDLDALMATYVPDDKTAVMGTGPGELWVGLDEIRTAHAEMFKAFDKEARKVNWFQAQVSGDVAWAMATMDVTNTIGDEEFTFALNMSTVFKKHKGKWLVSALHGSNLTGPQPEEGE
jgi:uncharacterized protein (TIGR02246 family)